MIPLDGMNLKVEENGHSMNGKNELDLDDDEDVDMVKIEKVPKKKKPQQKKKKNVVEEDEDNLGQAVDDMID